jgi:hypothetical protein
MLISIPPKYGGVVHRDYDRCAGGDIWSAAFRADNIRRGEDAFVLDYALGQGKSFSDVSSSRLGVFPAPAFGLAGASSPQCRYAADISMIKALR